MSSEDWFSREGIMNSDVMLGLNSDRGPVTSSTGVRVTHSGYLTNVNIDPDSLDDNSYRNEAYDSGDQRSDEDDNEPSYRTLTFKNGTDVNSIPIQKDGMAVCEKCGAIGVKHAFYSKSKRFCSLVCSRSYTILQREGKPIPKPQPIFKYPLAKVKIVKKEQNKGGGGVVVAGGKEDWFGKSDSKSVGCERDLSNSFTWESQLKESYFTAAPVSSFKHAPLFECWDNIMVGMKVEVENRDYDDRRESFPQSYWVASVIKVAGYKALLRYEGFGLDSSEDFWLNLCTEQVHPVGWCASQIKPLVPPKSIQHKHYDWKEFLVKRLTGARTLPADFHKKVEESMVSRFKVGMQLEVVDKNRISSTRIAYVEEVVGGRLHVKYCDADYLDEGFWCHERSPLIHPLNWSVTVGHDVTTPMDYARTLNNSKGCEQDADWDMFLPVKNSLADTNLKFKEGMKLEAIDPLNLATVCVATVTKVLRQSYLMIGIDGYNTESGSDWLCHHASSTSIFPAGFCLLNDIELTPPRGYRGEFKWFDYLKATKSSAAPVGLFNRELPDHGFKVGMQLEAVDLMEPRLICVGTITKVVGRLLRVHFDGWDTTYDQWCDCESPDLYPVGWCEVVGYPLQPARNYDVQTTTGEKKRKPKAQQYRGTRKKKRGRIGNLKGNKGQGKLGVNCESDDERSVASDVQDGVGFELHSPPPTGENNGTSQGGNSSDNDSVDTEFANTFESERNVSFEDNGNNRAMMIETNEDESVSHSGKTIPRLIDGSNKTSHQSVITPELWSLADVSQFLRINDCSTYCESFSKKKIDGRKFLTLTKEQIVNLTGMKVGPSLKIYDLIQQLKAKVHVS